eukprot:6755773-Alexandrium_andersonii.AAC.1
MELRSPDQFSELSSFGAPRAPALPERSGTSNLLLQEVQRGVAKAVHHVAAVRSEVFIPQNSPRHSSPGRIG